VDDVGVLPSVDVWLVPVLDVVVPVLDVVVDGAKPAVVLGDAELPVVVAAALVVTGADVVTGAEIEGVGAVVVTAAGGVVNGAAAVVVTT
jgi:hypothetical protein